MRNWDAVCLAAPRTVLMFLTLFLHLKPWVTKLTKCMFRKLSFACFSQALGDNIGHLQDGRQWLQAKTTEKAVQAKPWKACKVESVGALEYYPTPYISDMYICIVKYVHGTHILDTEAACLRH